MKRDLDPKVRDRADQKEPRRKRETTCGRTLELSRIEERRGHDGGHDGDDIDPWTIGALRYIDIRRFPALNLTADIERENGHHQSDRDENRSTPALTTGARNQDGEWHHDERMTHDGDPPAPRGTMVFCGPIQWFQFAIRHVGLHSKLANLSSSGIPHVMNAMRALALVVAFLSVACERPRELDPVDSGATIRDAAMDGSVHERGDVDSSSQADARDIDAGSLTPTRVLFIGNSYTSTNDLPRVVRAIGAATAGGMIETETIAEGGAGLSDHWFSTGARERIETGRFDVIVFQGQSSEPMLQGALFDHYAHMFADVANHVGARGIWFSTWARREGDAFYDGPGFGSNPALMSAQVEGRYAWAAHWHDHVVARVGAAFEVARAERPEIALHEEDGSHPTPAGTLLAACTIAQALTGRTPILPAALPLDVPHEVGSALCSLVPRIRCLSDVMIPCEGIPGCVNPFTDRANCGACGVTCPGTLSCTRGECGCPIGLSACAAECVVLRTNPQHCGACDVSCDEAGMPCHDGRCDCPNAERRDIRFAELGASGCESSSSPVSECAAAVHRHCAALDCYQSGFGPSMAAGLGLSLMCVRGDVRSTTYATLSAYAPECDGTLERVGPNCSTAISRYCTAMGSVSGFGPLPGAGDELLVTCLPHATVIRTTLDALAATPFSGCDGADAHFGFDCNNASWFVCTSMGHAGGFGPIEIDGDHASVVCVDG